MSKNTLTSREIQDMILEALMRSKHTKERLGQALFNIVEQRYPGLTEGVHGTDSDPFYNDNNIQNFTEFLNTKI